MRFQEPDGQKERLLDGCAQEINRGRRDVFGVGALYLDNPVVADGLGFSGDVLYADQRGAITGLAQRVQDVLAVVVEREATMGQAQHPAGVGALAGEQGRAAGRAGRCRARALPEQDTLFGQSLQVGGRHGVAVRLHVAAGIVGMDVQDVWSFHRVTPQT